MTGTPPQANAPFPSFPVRQSPGERVILPLSQDQDAGPVLLQPLVRPSSLDPPSLRGIVAIKARSTALTDSGLAKTSATSGSMTTTRLPCLRRPANRFGRA